MRKISLVANRILCTENLKTTGKIPELKKKKA